MPTDFQTRRRRKLLVAKVVAAFFCLNFAIYVVYAGLYLPFTWWRDGRRTARLAAMAYPDPHPDQSSLLWIREFDHGTNIATQWLDIEPTPPDTGEPSDALIMLVHTRIDPAPRPAPDQTVRMELTARGEAPRPGVTARSQTLTLTSGADSVRLRPDQGMPLVPSSSDANTPQDPLHYDIPAEFFVNAVMRADLSLSIADHQCRIQPNDFEALRAFAATLKPGYNPPPPNTP